VFQSSCLCLAALLCEGGGCVSLRERELSRDLSSTPPYTNRVWLAPNNRLTCVRDVKEKHTRAYFLQPFLVRKKLPGELADDSEVSSRSHKRIGAMCGWWCWVGLVYSTVSRIGVWRRALSLSLSHTQHTPEGREPSQHRPHRT